jgi:hypothetical protein
MTHKLLNRYSYIIDDMMMTDSFILGKRFFVITFVGSILWIAAYSYLMVWWANLTGETVHIPPEVSVYRYI